MPTDYRKLARYFKQYPEDIEDMLIQKDNERKVLITQLATARQLLEIFAEQAELTSHIACDDECEYKQAATWLKENPVT
jgi:hypothetical protein